MKKILMILMAFAAITLLPPPTVNAQPKVYNIGVKDDTAFGGATKLQTKDIASQGGITIQYALDHGADTCTGYVSLWASVDGIDYCPITGADSVAITADKPVRKLWFLGAGAITSIGKVNPVKFIQVRTRLVSNTTDGTSVAYIRSRLYYYQ